jgi:hypothetical protein
MIRSICQYETTLNRCQKRFRSRRAHKFCREHHLLVNGKPRQLNRPKRVKIVKSKPEAVEAKKRKK